MKRLLLFATLVLTINASAQTPDTFDIATFRTPVGWKKQPAQDAIQISTAKGDAFCLITLFKAVPGLGNSKEDFAAAWQTVVKGAVNVSTVPQMGEPEAKDGWEIQSGFATFEKGGNKGVAILVTASGFGQMMNALILTDTEDFQQDISSFLNSITLKQPLAKSQSTPASENDTASILGTWAVSASGTQRFDDYKNPYAANNYGYSKAQYTFNPDGTYSFISKTFKMTFEKILLVRESGSYQVNGNSITVIPQKSVIEAWSKKGGVDKWGTLLSRQSRTLEKTTYRFTKHYFSGIQQWNLVLQADSTTQRDGPFSGNTLFTNAWYYAPISANNTSIELPG